MYKRLHSRVPMANTLQAAQLMVLLISLMLPMEKFCVHWKVGPNILQYYYQDIKCSTFKFKLF